MVVFLCPYVNGRVVSCAGKIVHERSAVTNALSDAPWRPVLSCDDQVKDASGNAGEDVCAQQAKCGSIPLVIDYGAGNGCLGVGVGHAFASCINEAPTCVLVDKIRPGGAYDTPRFVPQAEVYRVKADISDVNICEMLRAIRRREVKPKHAILGDRKVASWTDFVLCAKHLCGGATDIALAGIGRCMLAGEALRKSGAGGKADTCVAVAVALCCHHMCTLDSYINPMFIKEHGFDATLFKVLVRVSTWGSLKPRQDKGKRQEQNGSENSDSEGTDEGGRTSKRVVGEQSGACETQASRLRARAVTHMNQLLSCEKIPSKSELSLEQRIAIGQLAKRFLDVGRLKFLEETLGFTHAGLRVFVDPNITCENVIMYGTR